MIGKKYHERFNIDVGTDEAKRRFVNRAHNSIEAILKWASDTAYRSSEVEKYVCTHLGERWERSGCLASILGDSFDEHLRALEAFAQFPWPELNRLAKSAITTILGQAETDLGIRWENDNFLPSGSPLLDQELVNHVLGSMALQEGVLIPFRKGLDHFLRSTNKPELLSDAITDMYEALEAQGKITARNDKDLSSNAELFISRLGVSNEYKPILKAYISYANEFRHAAEKGKKKEPPSRKETESFLYLTGLFLRLAII
jgi:hypothetical protein